MADELRYDSLGCMGNPLVKTPNIDRLAREGVLFTEGYCASPLCVPSRTSLFAGQYPSRTGCLGNGQEHHIGAVPGSFVVETLKKSGYKIGLAGKNHTFCDVYMEQWFDYREEYFHWGKTHGTITSSDRKVMEWRHHEKRKDFQAKTSEGAVLMEGLIEEPEPFPEEECMTGRIAQDAVRFVEENQGSPFFLYCSFPDPHWPNVVCEPYYSMYPPDELPALDEGWEIDWMTHPFRHFVQSQVNGFGNYSEIQRKRILATYYGMITYIDKAVGALVDKLKELGLYEDTLVIFCADHGNFAGRYGLIGKTGGGYDALVRIPLIIRFPEMGGNRVIDAKISNIDIFPTVFEYMGLELPQSIQGRSFLTVLEGAEKTHRMEIFAEHGLPVAPPPPMTREEFLECKKKRDMEDGTFWFVEYTGGSRSVMIKQGEWKYCYSVGDKEELYNLSDDPYEVYNLASCPEYDEIKLKLKDRMMDWILTVPFQGK